MIVLFFLILTIFAATLAAMDRLENETIHTSIFTKDKVNWAYWYKRDSWINKYIDKDPTKGKRTIIIKIGKFKINTHIRFPVGLTDGWHNLRSFSLVLVALASLTYRDITQYWLLDLVIIPLYISIVFSIFYSYFFKKK